MTTVTRLHAASEPGRLVNCWVIDVGDGLVTVDSSLLRSDALAHRARIDTMGMPVIAGLLTHGRAAELPAEERVEGWRYPDAGPDQRADP